MPGFRTTRLIPLVLLLALAGGAPAEGEGFAPTEGTAGTQVSITGHGFVPVRKPRVTFIVEPAGQEGLVDLRARVLAWSDLIIRVQAPAVAPGTYALRVEPRGGEGAPVTIPGRFRAVAPVISGVVGNAVTAGAPFSVEGVFGDVKGKLLVGRKKVKVLRWTNAVIDALVPKRLPPEPQPLFVQNATGTSPEGPALALDDPEIPMPEVVLSTNELVIQVPQNCDEIFHIFNLGDEGSTLSYVVKEEDGYLDVIGGVGDAPAGLGSGREVRVRLKPEFNVVDVPEALFGRTVVLSIYTPGATNFIKTVKSVELRTANQVAQRLVDTWSGTWSGDCYGPNNPMEAKPEAPVSGTWTLAIESVDLGRGTISGHLDWKGTDAFWTYDFDVNGHYVNLIPWAFHVDRRIEFSEDKGLIQAAGSHCHRFRVSILGMLGAANPSDAFYGPDVVMDLDPVAGTVVEGTTGFGTHPYGPGTQTWGSAGTLTGSKH